MSGLADLLKIDTGGLAAKLAGAADVHGASAAIGGVDPFALLGPAGAAIRSLGDLAKAPGDLPGAVSGGLGALAKIAPFADVPELGEVLAILERLKTRLQPLHDLMGLDPGALVNQVMKDAGGLDGFVQGLVGEVTDALGGEVPEAIAVPIGALRDLAAGAPGSPAAVAGFFARFVLGLELDRLRAPFELLDGVRAQVMAGGGDLGPLAAQLADLTLRVDQAADALLAGAPDLAPVVAGLAGVRGEIELLTGTLLPHAIEQLTGDIAAIEPGALAAKLDAALAPLIARAPVPPRGVAGFFLPPLRMLADGIDGLTLDALAEVFAGIEDEIRGLFAGSDVANLRDDIRNLLGGVTGFLNSLPLPSLRLRLTHALLGVEAKIAEFADLSPVGDLGTKLLEVTKAIDAIDLGAITAQIDALTAQISQAVDAFPIGAIKDELAGVLGVAVDAVKDLPPLVDELKQTIDALAAEITTIDLSAPGDQAAGVVRDLRAHVKQALGSVDLPAAAKVPIGILAGEVRKIDLTAGVAAPLDDLVKKIDVSQVLAPVQQAIDQARAALHKLSPSALAEQLDKPFDALLAALAQVSPAALIAQLSAGFKDAVAQLDHLDPVALIHPLQAEFDTIVGTLRAAADPKPLLAPLRAAYGEIGSILDEIDPTKLLGRLLGAVSKVPHALGDATGAAMAQKFGTVAPLPIPAGDAAGILKFGDIVRPFARLVEEARAVVHRAADGVIGEGLELIGRPLALLGHAGQVAGGHVADIAHALEARRGLVDPTAPDGPLSRLHAALERLAHVEAELAVGGRSSVALNAAVVSIQLDAHVTISFPARRQLAAAADGLTTGLSTPAVGRGFQALGHVLAAFAPSALALPASEGAVLAKVDALFDTIALTPLVDEMDAIGATIQAKLQSFAADIAKALFGIWSRVFEELAPVLPQGLLAVLDESLAAIRAQLAALDPATLEAELDQVLDGVVATLEAFSPAAFAGTLTGSFDALKAKIGALDPAKLLGDLNPIAGVIDQVKTLKPSLVLAPLAQQAEAVETALDALLDLDPVKIVADAIANLKAQIESVLQKIEVEIDGLLGDLEGPGGGAGKSVSL